MTDLSPLHRVARPRPVRAPRGSTLSCANWQIEAAFRMIQKATNLVRNSRWHLFIFELPEP